MKIRATAAFEAKKSLEIVELDLESPKAGEVLVEIMTAGICHTDAYTLREQINKGFGLMHAGTSVRSVVAY